MDWTLEPDRYWVPSTWHLVPGLDPISYLHPDWTWIAPGFAANLLREGTMEFLPTRHLLVNLGFPISRFPDFEISVFRKQILDKSGFYRSKTNNKGVMARPWTKRRVLRAISSTLKFQFTRSHEFGKIWRLYLVRQDIGDPGSIKMCKVFLLISVLPKPLNCHMGSTKTTFPCPPIFPVH